jgi:serine/threonine protein kinase
MMSVTQLLQTFQSGALSYDAFFAAIDRALAHDHANCTRLREVLDETQTKKPLPDEVYAEVVRHIERFSSKQTSVDDETRIQASPVQVNPRPASSAGLPGDPPIVEPERAKGIGDTLNGRFVLEECLGVGGMGTVYKALDLRKLEASDRKPYIAIKVLNVQFRGQPTSLIALQREARKAQTLAHRNILTVYDFDRDGPIVYLTMEYLSGKPLSKMLRAPGFTGMPYDKALPIITGMGRALAYAHERGFVHCDFKPANVFLTDSGEVKVIDFGIARAFQRADEDTDATIFDPASLGGITPAYASPEMFEHREPDPRDDIYALACVTYELLTGRHPFNRVSAIQARSEKRQPERPENLDRGQWRALSAALSFDRAARTPTVMRFLEGMGTPKRAPPTRIPEGVGTQKRAPSKRMPRASAAITAGALLVVVALWYGYRALSGGGETRPQASPPAKASSTAGSVATGGRTESGAATATPASAAPLVSSAATAPAAATPAPASTVAPGQAQAPALSLAAVMSALAGVPCSALYASVQDHALQVRGYVEERAGIAQLREALNGVPGLKTLNLDVQQVGGHNCDVVKTFAPYWTLNHQAANGASIRAKAPNGQLTEGSPLVVEVTTPPYDSYVNVDYYVLDGSIVHLVPSRHEKDNQAPPNYSATIGSMGDWVIAKPFGTEMIVLLTTPAPLFDAARPDSEPRADYLAAVDQRLKQMAAKYGAGRIAVDFVQITTRAGKG